ncbi:sterigmatocystin 8-O-methyltransferase precursor, putative [Coccidioides posadasii C735 delta SOWgp]|uniref:Sterigmatocystin 8-O-methyltransferase n=2 Tax=Coccidioides posadasii TaxID=199306 RepID=A0A0J6FMR3_COCPO|nr:sterigmatocystin 8-O-methyltransferase precursor, putative [Coccidioides posadasii C735 delta SOWgp]EER29453.1 sterigmatocystin 8-O-methyltransferase precursor, putative [Coccidioides posadasii C735 delta SOWgp]KMM70179.1 sterigmatocystin 8-O-methyltransferase [Coccidioides posadasii RMSCC 3488]|eukprot:XP_003071598.1 sterigmatocystin 8-O-methyltransferase precursor, putative [Coccidioides posadasii C735 delta SOWgp]
MAAKLDDVVALSERIETVLSNPQAVTDLQDDGLRRRLRDAGRKLSLAMEAPGDTIHRIAYAPMQLALARVGIDIRLFDILSEGNGSSFTHEELAKKTKVDIVLMKRLLRYYQSVGMVLQLDEDTYTATNVTEALASDGGRYGVYIQFDLLSPAIMAFPKFLQQNGYCNPIDPSKTAFHLGMHTSQTFFQWLQSHPQDSENFGIWMSAQRESRPIFLDVMDFEGELGQGTNSSTVLFVDIGGSKGHQSIALRQRYPGLPGRIIVQDLEHVLAEARQNPLSGFESIEAEVYDMFLPQTIKGARAYYLRQVLHDWPNDKCKVILENIKAGMSQDSTLLIDEMVISERNAPWRATQADFTMAVALSSMQRTETEWRALLEAAGFRIRKILKYREELEDCVIVAAPN